jgi:hypothetical protein
MEAAQERGSLKIDEERGTIRIFCNEHQDERGLVCFSLPDSVQQIGLRPRPQDFHVELHAVGRGRILVYRNRKRLYLKYNTTKTGMPMRRIYGQSGHLSVYYDQGDGMLGVLRPVVLWDKRCSAYRVCMQREQIPFALIEWLNRQSPVFSEEHFGTGDILPVTDVAEPERDAPDVGTLEDAKRAHEEVVQLRRASQGKITLEEWLRSHS